MALFISALVRTMQPRMAKYKTAHSCLAVIHRFSTLYRVPAKFVSDNMFTLERVLKCLVFKRRCEATRFKIIVTS